MTAITMRKQLDDLTISSMQATIAMHQFGWLEAVEAYINAPTTDPVARLAYQRATHFKRTSPTLLAVASAVGIPSADLDQMFVFGRGVEV